MTKKRAFLSEHGRDMVTAEAVGRLRTAQYNGQPTGKVYYSTHRPGHRRPVRHVMKGSSWFFAYNEAEGSGGVAGGESLQHLLFKEALARVTRTRLMLYLPGSNGKRRRIESHIVIHHAEQEWTIPGPVPYRSDLYIEFSSSDGLATKWEGRVCVEVRRSHAVDAEKQDAFRALDIPVIEVDLDKVPVYRYDVPDDATTDAKEEAYRERIRKMLESDAGFLQAVVLSDPSSKAYLLAYNQALRSKLKEVDEANARMTPKLQELAAECADSHVVRGEALARLQVAERQLADANSAIAVLKHTLQTSNIARQTIAEEAAGLRLDVRFLYVILAVLMTTMLLACGWMLWTM